MPKSDPPVIAELRRDIEFASNLRGHELHFRTTWGLFHPRGIDQGTRLLIEQLEVAPDSSVLDLGCGYGAIGLFAAKLAPQGFVHLVDRDYIAVEYAKRNALLNSCSNTSIYLSNGFSAVPDDRLDIVASNLPAKVGNELLSLFFYDSYQRLSSGGALYVVVISGLKDFIKRRFREMFGNCEKLKQGRGHVVLRALKA